MGIGHIIGLIVFGFLVLYIVYTIVRLLFHGLFSETVISSNYFVLHSRSQLNKVSAESKVLLVTDSVLPYLGARWAFEQTHLQTLHSLTENKNIKICWFNIQPYLSRSHADLKKYLKNKGVRGKGFSLFNKGELLKYEPIRGKLDLENEKTIRVVKKLLRM